ncbi:MAG: sigma-70 family RNA polymerase sigma factor [Sphingobacteriales bacterium]|nr:MAG: sigma-70 family RNA polymerase sigma factor [Sphingobacteriales bacterium]
MQNEFLKQLFQQEFTKMVAVISKLYGLQHIETAEDIVSETFLQATQTWAGKGIPDNPTAWLYTVAKNRTLQDFRRNKIYAQKVMPAIKSDQEIEEAIPEPDFSEQYIKDSQLQMIFAICNPAVASEAQIGLALRILCGFGIDEIAEAFLSNKETINKRLFRAKEKLRTEQIKIELPPPQEINKRLDNVLHVIYLLFNEGYYSKTQNSVLRKDLCIEALRLGLLLTQYEATNQPKTKALIALMCFHASRFDARQTEGEAIVLYEDQDEKLWDEALINQGKYYLNQSLKGDELTSYHLEARIAYWHCIKEDSSEKWDEILQLYNHLLLVNYSPSVALNRTYALYKVKGAAEAIVEAEKLKLENNHFYFVLLGELYKSIDASKALAHLHKAKALAKTAAEQNSIQQKIAELNAANR